MKITTNCVIDEAAGCLCLPSRLVLEHDVLIPPDARGGEGGQHSTVERNTLQHMMMCSMLRSELH
jgi:hypothetical protein